MNFDISWVLHMKDLAFGKVTNQQLYIGHSLCWPKSTMDWMREIYRWLLRFCLVVILTFTSCLQTMQSKPHVSFVWKDLKYSRQSHATNYTERWHPRTGAHLVSAKVIHRSKRFNRDILPLALPLVEATGHRMAFETAKEANLNSKLLDRSYTRRLCLVCRARWAE